MTNDELLIVLGVALIIVAIAMLYYGFSHAENPPYK